MSDDRPRPGGLFDVDLSGGEPVPSGQRLRKPTIALDGGPSIRISDPASRPHPAVTPPNLISPPVVPPPLVPTEASVPSFHVVRPSHVPPPLPERTVLIAPELAPEVSEHSATPNTGAPPLGAADWQGVGPEESELGDMTEEDLCGLVVASHRLESRVGGGGFADVYLGRHEFLARTSAVKLLRRSLAASETTRRRFQREAEVLAALGHPNVVRLIDYGVLASGRPFLVTELVEGRTLRNRLDSGEPITPEMALEWSKQLARGLAALHALGVVHRDLKPTNVMVSASKNELKILDLGIARWLEPGDRTRLTEAGRLLGTPKYSAPEQLLDPANAGPPADLYALGSILYEMLTGHAPFWGGDRAGAMEEKRTRAPTPPPGQTGLEPIAQALLEPNPERRIGTAAELLARLDDVQLGVPTRLVPTPMATQIIATPGVGSMPGAPVQLGAIQKRLRGSPRVWVWAGLAAVLAFVVGVGTTVLVMRGSGEVVQVGGEVEPRQEGIEAMNEPVEARTAPALRATAAPSPTESTAPVGGVAAPSVVVAADRVTEAPTGQREADYVEDEDTRRSGRRSARPSPSSKRPVREPARVVVEPARAMTARGEVEKALAQRGLTALDLPRLVEGETVSRWQASLSEDDARVDAATRALVRAIQDAPVTIGVIDAQIRRVLAATQSTSLGQAQVQTIEDRCFELRRDLASATAARREEIAREVTGLERKLHAP